MSVDYISIARGYESDILSGVIPSCRETKLAIERAQRDRARSIEDPSWSYRFDESKAARICRFASALRHVKSSIATKAGEFIVLGAWQAFILTELYGWVRKDSGNRRFKKAWVQVGKGNGKSTLAGITALYDAFALGEGGADVLCSASNRDQARIVLDSARSMLLRDKQLCKELGLKIQAHDVLQAATQSRLRALPAKASSVEGVSPSLAILDEVHASRGRELYDTLSTACAKRASGLLLMVTTAGNDSAGLGYEMSQFVYQLLTQEVDAHEFFAMVYGIDSNDEWDNPLSWQKANPNWKVSVSPEALAAEAATAKAMPGAKKAFRVFHLSCWEANGADEAFLDFNAVHACFDKDLNEAEFLDQPAVFGLDLASKLDLCSLVRVHSKSINGKMHYYVFSKNFLPQLAVSNSPVAAIRTWAENGQLVVTPGAVTSYDDIEEEIYQEWKKVKARDLNFDPMQATMIVSHLRNRTECYDSFVEITQFARNMTDGMGMLAEIVADGRLHTNSQPLLWCLTNLRAQHGGLHFVWPVRPKDRSQKIDASVALIMALKSIAACPLDESQNESVYTKRGIIFLDANQRWKCKYEGCEQTTGGSDFCGVHS